MRVADTLDYFLQPETPAWIAPAWRATGCRGEPTRQRARRVPRRSWYTTSSGQSDQAVDLEDWALLRSIWSQRLQLRELQLGERQDVAASPRGRAHAACQGGHGALQAVHSRARLPTWRTGPALEHPEP
jgi:hypothetical protein